MTWRDMAVLDFAFVQERFDEELARMDTISAAVAWPVGVLTALGGLMVGMAGNYTYEPGWLTRLFLGCVAVHAITFIVAILHFARAYHGASYSYPPPLGELARLHEVSRRLARSEGDDDEEVLAEFTSRLQWTIAEAADLNAKNNVRRMTFLHQANTLLMCVLVFTAVAALPYAATKGRDSFMSKTDAPPKADQLAEADVPAEKVETAEQSETGPKEKTWKSKMPKIEFELRHWWEEPKPPGKRKVM